MSLVQKLKRERMLAKALGPSYLTSQRPIGQGVVRAMTRHGELFFRPGESDLLTFWHTLGAREYDLDRFPQSEIVSRAYEQALAAGRTPVILDAGANVGAASVWFSIRFPEARIIAVEPDPANADLCRRNTKGRNVEVVQAAIGARPGTVSLQPSDQAWGIQTVRGGDIPIVTVEGLLHGIADPAFLIAKIDIEGFEADLFAEATGWLEDVTAVIIEPHDWMLPGKGSSRSFRAAFGPEFDLLISGENLVFIRNAPAASSAEP
jgi:FkbM family methyltransferase